MFKTVLALLPFVLTVAASPLVKKQSQDPCAKFGAVGLDNLAQFQLATYAAGSSVGTPLVLGSDGAISGEELHFLITADQYSDSVYNTFVIENGAMLPITDGSNPVGVTNSPADSGYPPAWVTGIDLAAPYDVYCAVTGTENPVLAVHGDTSSWSLCQGVNLGQPQNLIVYQAAEDNESGAYDFDTCYPVTIQLIEL